MPRRANVKADIEPIAKQITKEGKIPDKEVPRGMASMEAPMRFFIRFGIDDSRLAVWNPDFSS
jgi:hypothetical protein